MCGISGKFFFKDTPVDKKDEASMRLTLDTMRQRGPDHQGFFQNEKMILGHTRLSILDLDSRSDQPMKDSTGRYWLSYNGEIYNYQTLRNELINEGVVFKTTSDTEVLLHLLIKKGEAALEKLNGFFAFAFIDMHKQELVMARDPAGIKPLCYSIQNDFISFASRASTLIPLIPKPNLDLTAIGQLLRYTYIPAPLTIFEGVHKLKPQHLLVVKPGGEVNMRKYRAFGSHSESTDLKNLLYQSVEDRLVSEVPLGTFLSGGVDSSIISAIACDLRSGIDTFSLTFKQDTLFDESDHAKKVSKHIGSRHHEIPIDETHLEERIDRIIDDLDEPFADSSAIALHTLSQGTREQVTVALSGDGADELFAGYNKHRALLLANQNNLKNSGIRALAKLMPSGNRHTALGNKFRQLRKYGEGLGLNPEDRFEEWASFMSKKRVESLIRQESFTPYQFDQRDFDGFNTYLLMDQEMVLTNDMLKKVDAMSMAHSLEVRTPFLDGRIVNYANNLPWEEKLDTLKGKKVLSATFKQLLPQEIFDRKKHGFEVPLYRWFTTHLKSRLDACFSPKSIEAHGIMNPKEVSSLWHSMQTRPSSDLPLQIWTIFVLHQWLDRHYA